MKSTCHALTIVVFLLVSISAFAVQSGTKLRASQSSKREHVQLRSALPASDAARQPARDPFMPVPLSSIQSTGIHHQVQNMAAGYSSAVPLLSCIGAGMVIGGLVSVRLTRRLHR